MKPPKLVMIVDDDKSDRFFFRTSLEEIDPSIACVEAGSGIAALETLRGAHWLPDYIFLDANMTGMSGIECLKEIKKDERLSNIPVIMYSGAFSTQETVESYASGAAYTLTKTADFNELPETIKKAMDIVKANAIYK
jgi:CheY-like chemotaxis protein